MDAQTAIATQAAAQTNRAIDKKAVNVLVFQDKVIRR